MKAVLLWLSLAIGLLSLTGCGESSPDTSELPMPASMKGYELYSWRNEEVWRFTLITGSNRLKNIDEIKHGSDEVTEDGWVKITVSGEANLRDLISRLPAGEQILWLNKLPGSSDAAEFTYPEADDIERIKEFCTENGVSLTVLSG